MCWLGFWMMAYAYLSFCLLSFKQNRYLNIKRKKRLRSSVDKLNFFSEAVFSNVLSKSIEEFKNFLAVFSLICRKVLVEWRAHCPIHKLFSFHQNSQKQSFWPPVNQTEVDESSFSGHLRKLIPFSIIEYRITTFLDDSSVQLFSCMVTGIGTSAACRWFHF